MIAICLSVSFLLISLSASLPIHYASSQKFIDNIFYENEKTAHDA